MAITPAHSNIINFPKKPNYTEYSASDWAKGSIFTEKILATTLKYVDDNRIDKSIFVWMYLNLAATFASVEYEKDNSLKDAFKLHLNKVFEGLNMPLKVMETNNG